MTWQPLETCPENKQVLFAWADSDMVWAGWTSRTLQGTRYFWGPGANVHEPDDNPPSRWCEIPAWEDK